MANYYNPQAYYQYPYNNYSTYQQPQQSYAQNNEMMKWVEGEVGAKAFQMPMGWPANTPIALWDSTEERIFLKSWNQVGMANPMMELVYKNKNPQPQMLNEGVSGHEEYATKQEIEELKKEIKNLTASIYGKNDKREKAQV